MMSCPAFSDWGTAFTYQCVDSVGLLQMYMGGQLVHADYMFNGYGTTKRDFMKQVGNVVLTLGPPVLALFLGCL